MGELRVQLALARAGLGSRRSCEALLRAGRVTVNGRRAELGSKADPERDDIRVDGQRLGPAEPVVHIVLHKPRGVLSSLRAQGGRRTVRDLVGVPYRLYPVGRLDADSEGLIVLTNDGRLALQLTHPSHQIEKEYRVLLREPPDEAQLRAWRAGVRLPDGGRGRAARVWREPGADRRWVRVVLREGRKRQIRETARMLGLRVERLVRVRMGGLSLGRLPPGAWRALGAAEVRALTARATGSPARRRASRTATPRARQEAG